MVKDNYKLRRVADKDASSVPSHWIDVSDKVKGKPWDKPNWKNVSKKVQKDKSKEG